MPVQVIKWMLDFAGIGLFIDLPVQGNFGDACRS